MTHETIKRLEELNEHWANESLHPSEEKDIGCEVMDHLPDLIAAVKERDAALKAVAEMRDALNAIGQCPACGGDGIFHPECQACLSGEPDRCTCANEPAQPCPVCQESEKALYDKVKQALSTDCGKGYIKAESLKCFNCGDGYTPLYCLNCANERDTAQRACAEMRLMLFHSYSWIRCEHCGEGYCDDCKKQRELTDHALSADCGRGYYHEREIEPLVEALHKINYGPHEFTYQPQDIAHNAIEHWEKVKGEK